MARRLAIWLLFFALARLESKLETFRTGTAACQWPDVREWLETLMAWWRT